MALYIKSLKDESIHRVFKYIDTTEGLNELSEISIWSNTWYGRHVVGFDCELLTEQQFKTLDLKSIQAENSRCEYFRITKTSPTPPPPPSRLLKEGKEPPRPKVK